MAEESGELMNTGEPDAVSTAAGARQDEILEIRDDADSLSGFGTQSENDAPEETEHIKAQIEETRSQMGETIDAIQEKLSFENISEQVKEQVSEHINSALETAKESVYEATVGNLGKAGKFMQNVGKEISKSDAGKFARKNPFPLVLVGLGIGLLAYEFSGKSKKNYSALKPKKSKKKYIDDYESSESRKKSALKSATEKIGEVAGNTYETVSDATGTALQSVGGAASLAYGTVTDAAGNAYSSVEKFAGDTYEKVGDYSSQARQQYDYHIEENPLAVGAVALAIGAAVGLAIPATRYEGEMLGEYRQQLIDKARETANNLVDRAKDAASQARDTISGEVGKSVDEVKQKFVDAGKDFDSAQ